MENRVIQLVQQIKDEQRNPWDETKESHVDHGARLALEDEWIGGLYYKGNSVSWSHSKAKHYSDDLMKAWAALAEIGVHSDGQTHIADVIKHLKITIPEQS